MFVNQVLHETRERPETRAYLEDLKNMRKVGLLMCTIFVWDCADTP